MSKLELRTLGTLNITLNHEPIFSDTSRRKAEALALYLVSEPREHAREVLATLFWEDYPQNRALSNLRVVLHTLKSLLAPYFHITRQTVAFIPSQPYWYDVEEVKRACAAIHMTQDPHKLQALFRTLQAYKGDFLAGFHIKDSRMFEMWQIRQQEYMAGIVLDAYNQLIEYYERRHNITQAIHIAEQMLDTFPATESGYTHLIRLLIASGKQDIARVRYEAYIALLKADDPGATPSPELDVLVNIIGLSQVPVGDATTAILTAERPPSTLPGQLTAFINRDRELADILERLNDASCRLLTLTGPGGVGKTRLSLQAAQVYHQHMGQPVYFVPLADALSAQFIPPAIADALNIPLSGGQPPLDDVIEHLAKLNVLVVLDNFEHLIADGASVIHELLTRAPHLRLMITSRVRLDFLGEWVLPVGGMRVPDSAQDNIEAYPAVQLFVQGARRIQPGFDLLQSRAAVVRICQLVDGLPLAIDMATGWLSTMTAEVIADEIAHSLTILSTSARNVPERHKSLSAVFVRSWQLLTQPERAALMRLSVLRGRFTEDAALAITGHPHPDTGRPYPDILKRLVNHSLVQAQPDGTFRLHELIRQYAYEHLCDVGDEATAHADHYEYYFRQITTLTGRVREQGLEDSYLMAQTERHIENIRAAMGWAAAHQRPADVIRFAVEIGYYWELSCLYGEGLYWLELGLQMPAALTDVEHTKALYYAGMLTYMQSDFDRCEALGEENLRISRQSGNLQLIVRALQLLGNVYLARSDFERACDVMAEALDYAYQAEDTQRINLMLASLGSVCTEMGAFEDATAYYEQCLPYMRANNRQHYVATILANMGLGHTKQGQFQQAEASLTEALALFDVLENRSGQALALGYMGETAEGQGDLPRARELQMACLRLNDEINHRAGGASALFFLARIAQRTQDFEEAARLLGMFESVCAALDMPPAVKHENYDAVRQAVLDALGQPDFDRFFEVGQATSPQTLLMNT